MMIDVDGYASLGIRAFVGGVALLCSGLAASAQVPNSIIVFLYLQDFSDCTNSTVNPKDPINGTVAVLRNSDGTTSVKVAITGTPDTKYNIYLKCQGPLGIVTTGDEGTGSGTFSFPTNRVGGTYAFDMYPDGAPAGNKFQSGQIVFK